MAPIAEDVGRSASRILSKTAAHQPVKTVEASRISQQSTNKRIFKLPVKLFIASTQSARSTPRPVPLLVRCRSGGRLLRQNRSAPNQPALGFRTSFDNSFNPRTVGLRVPQCSIGPGIYGFGVGPPSSAAEQPKQIGLRPSACRL